MKETVSEEKKAAKREYWRGRIAEQERSGLSVQQFCKEQALTEQAFYFWRKRLRNQEPMRFALVETGTQQQPGRDTSLAGCGKIMVCGWLFRTEIHKIVLCAVQILSKQQCSAICPRNVGFRRTILCVRSGR
jgi:hypothetical protein